MSGEKNQETNVSSSNKWKVFNTTPNSIIHNLSARAIIWQMAFKKVNNLSKKKEDYQFKFGCMSYLNLKQNKAFKEQVDKCLSSRFDSKTST